MAKKRLSYIELLCMRVKIYWNSKIQSRFDGRKSFKYARQGVAFFLIVGLIGGYYFFGQRPMLLLADGKEVGLVDSPRAVEKALEMARQELSQELDMEVTGAISELSFEKEGDHAGQILEGEDLVAVLKEELDWPINTWAIKADGKPLLYLASETEAQKALEDLKAYYLPQEDAQENDQEKLAKDAETAVNVEKVELQDDVQVVPAKSTSEQLMTKDEAVEAMVTGLEKIVQHSVNEGESLWTIARDNNLTVAELQEMNPTLKGELLQIGQELNLKKAEPLVNVVSVLTMTTEEKIPFKVEYENDASLWKGQEKVKKSGENGLKKVTYRITQTNDQVMEKQTLQETILQEPATKVVRKGTKLIVASRSGGGSGTLGWPIRGSITSAYGKYRGGSRHTGMDIDGDTGDPVGAAEDGTVARASWKGTYGNCVEINHGQGLVTRYAHLSKMDVSVGQKVARGDLIGRVGSTGKSTGSHLHFEVIENGKFVNPRNLLK